MQATQVELGRITTAYIERLNATLGTWMPALVRRTHGAIAWRLAPAYAKERAITDEQAMLELFEEVTDNTTPALAVA